MQKLKDFFAQTATPSSFDSFVNSELAHLPVPFDGEPKRPESIFVCGRFGAGKSTFSDNWLGHPEYFPNAAYHIDSDRIMKALYQANLADTPGDLHNYVAVEGQIKEGLALLGTTYVHSSVGKERLTPMQFRLPKTFPGYKELDDQDKIVAKPCGHMVLCDQEVALERVRGRQANGGHPYSPLVGELEDKYRFKQAEIIYGLPLYADNTTGKYFVWDASDKGEMSLVLSITKDGDQRSIEVHDKARAEKFGLTEDNLKAIFTLYDQYHQIAYDPILAQVLENKFMTDGDKELFRATCDKIDIGMMRKLASNRDGLEKILDSAISDPSPISFKSAEPVTISPMRAQNYAPVTLGQLLSPGGSAGLKLDHF